MARLMILLLFAGIAGALIFYAGVLFAGWTSAQRQQPWCPNCGERLAREAPPPAHRCPECGALQR